MLALLAAAPKGPLDTWSPTLFALLALLLPLIALVIVLAFTVDSRRVSAAIAILFTLAAVGCALVVVAIEIAHPLHLERNATFLQLFTGQSGVASEFLLQWGVLADPLAAVMLIAVTLTSLLVQVYALAFIRREDGPVRFFSVLLFATFAMTGVTLSTSYFEMLLFFGLVTLSTYLMIGYWWQREEAAAAAARAFVLSLAGDLALLAGIAYIFFRFGELNFQTLATQYTGGKVSANGLFIMSILVFLGAAAKSAQFPLHAWLPGSAQAPAPAAALLHSGGAALCGVYLLARAYALFHASPRALALLAIVLLTAGTFLGAMALVRVFRLAFTGETARRRRFEPERIRDAGGRIAIAMVILAIPCTVAGIRGIRGRTDPIAFVTFPGVTLSNSHFVAAGIIAAAAVLGAGIAWAVYARRPRPVVALEPVRRAMAEGLFVERAYHFGAAGLLMPASRAAGWIERRVDATVDLVADSVAFAGQPRRWLPDVRPRQLVIGLLAGLVVLATVSMMLAGRVIGRVG